MTKKPTSAIAWKQNQWSPMSKFTTLLSIHSHLHLILPRFLIYHIYIISLFLADLTEHCMCLWRYFNNSGESYWHMTQYPCSENWRFFQYVTINIYQIFVLKYKYIFLSPSSFSNFFKFIFQIHPYNRPIFFTFLCTKQNMTNWYCGVLFIFSVRLC